MSVGTFLDILPHVGHEIVCLHWEGVLSPSVKLECKTCNYVLAVINRDEEGCIELVGPVYDEAGKRDDRINAARWEGQRREIDERDQGEEQ